MKNKNLFGAILFGKPIQIDDEIVAYYKKNPKELDLIVDREHFYSRFLSFFFFLGLSITIGTRVLKFLFEDDFGKFINDVVLDVGSELGIAIFGGSVTAYFLELLQKRQYDQNIKFRDAIKARL